MNPGECRVMTGVTVLVVCGPAWAGSLLEFQEPNQGSVYPYGAEVPVVLRAQADDETVTWASVFVDGQLNGIAGYCCPFCPCFAPMPGMMLELQIARSWDTVGGGNVWRGLTNLPPGVHRLTAQADGSGETHLESTPRTVTVLNPGALDLRVSEGLTGQLLFVLPEGSLVPGGFDLWLSRDLRGWTRLGPFSPGNVAAFSTDQPDPQDDQPRYYRALPSE